MRLLIALSGLAAAATPADAARTIFAGGNWAAIDFGARCEARSRAVQLRKGTEPFAGFAFDRQGKRQGQFYVHLSRPARPGATVIATIGSRPFLLAGRGEWAWSRAADQQGAMLDAARYATGMRVESRDQRGRRIVDRYLLAGAATAIDSAAAACAGKSPQG
jgi:hypothetical protein